MYTIEPPKLATSGELEIMPSENSSQNDFDFLVGEWKVRNRKLKTRLDHCEEWIEFEAVGEMRKILNGIGNIDSFNAFLEAGPFEGMSLRLFNPATRLWSIYWADSSRGVLDTPVTGSFDRSTGYFFGKDVLREKEIVVVFKWDASVPGSPIWSQAFWDDSAKAWEWNWYMYMSKVSLPPKADSENA